MKTTTNKRRYAIRDIKEKNQRRAPRLPFLLALIILSIYLSPTVPAQETLITEDDKVRPSDGPLGFEFGLSIALDRKAILIIVLRQRAALVPYISFKETQQETGQRCKN